jgi:hypothetical protein
MLSRRCLYIAEKTAFFHCPTAIDPESGFAMNDLKENHFSLNPLYATFYSQNNDDPYNYGDLENTYQTLTMRYSRRRLSFASDILLAFQGIANFFERRGAGPFLFGLPESCFDLALLWIGCGSGRRRSTISTTIGTSSYIPSWTWAGWETPILEYLWRTGSNSSDHTRLQPVQSEILAVRVYDGRVMRDVHRLQTPWLSIRDSGSILSRTDNPQHTELPRLFPGTLQFFARTLPLSTFSVQYSKPVGHEIEPSCHRYYLINSDHHRVGVIESAEVLQLDFQTRRYDLVLLSQYNEWARHKWIDILLGWSDEDLEDELRRWNPDIRNREGVEESAPWTRSDTLDSKSKTGRNYTHSVMLTETNSTTAERVAIGLTDKDPWDSEANEWRLITLA